ncbi:RNA polymerase, sigma-24 subunit, ECF subfamily [Pseudoxanthomonas suwonensis 11-1]|uniref:RNA polymerase, sigma-24 subunit, ECF subfamily n=1 Tax=Pseudoxanthomonas suwonensis (strain 11-1) TaxID=743721 RepID=E6WVK7_PSEUU|nr:RNA polymerase sigma factor [Pseudoxanthomonas suwonensis]ADV28206.1 RNA polymerase, sigma-24 subunit, ECF subfamily [Pseudoxanthomonas suwonensis 11-1]
MLVTTPAPPEMEAPAAAAWGSLDAFLAEVGTRAFRFAEAGLRNRDDALDAVQDAMMRMIAYQDRPAAEWTPLFWSILRRRIIDLQRRSRFRLRWMLPAVANDDPRGEDTGIDWADTGPGPAETQERGETYARLVEALRTLPARQREAFTLRVLEELDVATTAQVMGCSEGSVKTHLSRARQALNLQLEDVL